MRFKYARWTHLALPPGTTLRGGWYATEADKPWHYGFTLWSEDGHSGEDVYDAQYGTLCRWGDFSDEDGERPEPGDPPARLDRYN
jgi:hypothetical protein